MQRSESRLVIRLRKNGRLGVGLIALAVLVIALPIGSATARRAVSTTLSANPLTIPQGELSTLSWSSTNAATCRGSDFSTGGAVSGTTTVLPTATTTYSITCELTSSNQATATTTVTMEPASGPCPHGTNYISAGDGCEGAQSSGSWLVPTFFAGYTGTTYSYRPPWNVAGVDYPVGYSGTLLTASGPGNLAANTTPSGCATYYNNYVTIKSTPCTITHINFATGGPGGTCVGFNAQTSGGTVTLDNDWFALTSDACTGTVALLNFCSGGSSDVIIQYTEIDGGRSLSSSGFSAIPGEEICTDGPSLLIKYSAFIDNIQHAFYTGSSSVTAEYSFGQGFGSNVPGTLGHGAHGNWDYLSNSHANITFLDQFNTKWADASSTATTVGEMANDASNWNTTSQYNVAVGSAGVSALWEVGGGEGGGTSTNPWAAGNELIANNYYDATSVLSWLYATSVEYGTVSNPKCTANINLLTGARITGAQGSGNFALNCN